MFYLSWSLRETPNLSIFCTLLEEHMICLPSGAQVDKSLISSTAFYCSTHSRACMFLYKVFEPLLSGLPQCGRTWIRSGVKSTRCTSRWGSIRSPFMSWTRTRLGNAVVRSRLKMILYSTITWLTELDGWFTVLWAASVCLTWLVNLYVWVETSCTVRMFWEKKEALTKQTSSGRWAPRLSD